jgi:hypothetical protein
MRRLWRDHSLTIVLVTGALLWTGLSLWAGWTRYGAEETEHGATADLAGFLPYWTHDVLTEFIGEWTVGILAIVWLTKQFRGAGFA